MLKVVFPSFPYSKNQEIGLHFVGYPHSYFLCVRVFSTMNADVLYCFGKCFLNLSESRYVELYRKKIVYHKIFVNRVCSAVVAAHVKKKPDKASWELKAQRKQKVWFLPLDSPLMDCNEFYLFIYRFSVVHF